MTLLVFLSGLASALLHAGWNAAARTRPDPGHAVASVVIMAGVLAMPFAIAWGPPPMTAWKWLAMGMVTNMLTMRALMATYRRLPFAVGYPLVRGVAPVGVAGISFAVFGETPSPLAIAGIAAISAGVLLLGESARRGVTFDRVGLALALFAGVFNALFVVSDAQGVRATGDALTYGFTVCIVNSLSMAAMLAVEGVDVPRMLRKEGGFGFLASMASTGSYLFILYGYAHGPSGAVSALRETSLFIGMLLAATVLHEKVGWLRWCAAAMAVAGIALLRLS
ncbi:EamA family transporter [Alsobacter sp. SYSU M60028]|uniref:EamA family transporter n=1 Tax=Alsobacter ponti TaxID=2962936 RepID=A0ABT1L965_9HYPH|nr:EamA family transporter [Alsobacter ponti]MCP8938027.1 EamA family transporter [Alsobacter ponti]